QGRQFGRGRALREADRRLEVGAGLRERTPLADGELRDGQARLGEPAVELVVVRGQRERRLEAAAGAERVALLPRDPPGEELDVRAPLGLLARAVERGGRLVRVALTELQQ